MLQTAQQGTSLVAAGDTANGKIVPTGTWRRRRRSLRTRCARIVIYRAADSPAFDVTRRCIGRVHCPVCAIRVTLAGSTAGVRVRNVQFLQHVARVEALVFQQRHVAAGRNTHVLDRRDTHAKILARAFLVAGAEERWWRAAFYATWVAVGARRAVEIGCQDGQVQLGVQLLRHGRVALRDVMHFARV